jgi:uncharacterized protein
MHRRNILTAALAGIGGALAGATRAQATTMKAAQASPDKAKVVYHLCDLDKVNFVLGNIRNHFDGMGGPDKVSIALVVHGPALKAFQTSSASPDLAHPRRRIRQEWPRAERLRQYDEGAEGHA